MNAPNKSNLASDSLATGTEPSELMQQSHAEDSFGRDPSGAALHYGSTIISCNTPHLQQVAPAPSVSSGVAHLTTKAGLTRQRIKWTTEMNKDVIRSYMLSTKVETDRTGYRKSMHRIFISKYPELSTRISEQNIVDRKRAIITRNLLSETEINEIKQKIQQELTAKTETQQAPHDNADQDQMINQELQATNTMNDLLKQQVEDHFNTAMLEYMGTDPCSRHLIPKVPTNKQFHTIIELLNSSILPQHIEECTELEKLHTVVYCAIVATVRTLGFKTTPHNLERKRETQRETKPKWMIRLEKRVNDLRVKIGQLTQYKRGIRTKKLKGKVSRIIAPIRMEMLDQEKLTEILDDHTQQLGVYSKRLRRYKECTERKLQNKAFHTNQRKFYRKLQNSRNVPNTTASSIGLNDVTAFWADIWEREKKYEKGQHWLAEEEKRFESIDNMPPISIQTEDVRSVIKSTPNWKTSGPDGIQHFWYKKFTCTHEALARCYNEIVYHPDRIPPFLMKGQTYLLQKEQNTEDPSKYRPITCQPTMYKMLTSVIAAKINEYLNAHNILTEEQKGCYKNSKGCKDQIIIDSIIMNQAIKKQRNLNMACIDYKKAFDSMPQDYLIEILRVYKIMLR